MIPARFLILALPMLAIGAAIHVASTGSDTALETLDQPLATVTTALAKARPLIGREPVAITLANGVHRLTQPVNLGPADSGTAAAPLVIAGSPEFVEHPVADPYAPRSNASTLMVPS